MCWNMVSIQENPLENKLLRTDIFIAFEFPAANLLILNAIRIKGMKLILESEMRNWSYGKLKKIRKFWRRLERYSRPQTIFFLSKCFKNSTSSIFFNGLLSKVYYQSLFYLLCWQFYITPFCKFLEYLYWLFYSYFKNL